jgi:zona occludens toxin
MKSRQINAKNIWNSVKSGSFLCFSIDVYRVSWLVTHFQHVWPSDPSPDLTTTDVRDAAMFRSSAATPAPDTPSEPTEPPLSTEWRISGE